MRLALAGRDWAKLPKTAARIIVVLAEIWTRDLPNTEQEYLTTRTRRLAFLHFFVIFLFSFLLHMPMIFTRVSNKQKLWRNFTWRNTTSAQSFIWNALLKYSAQRSTSSLGRNYLRWSSAKARNTKLEHAINLELTDRRMARHFRSCKTRPKSITRPHYLILLQRYFYDGSDHSFVFPQEGPFG